MKSEISIILMLMLIAIIFCALGVVWDQHLTIAAQDKTINMLQEVKCMVEFKT